MTYPQPGYSAPGYAPPQPTKPRTPWWAVLLIVLSVANLALMTYVFIFVVRLQMGLAELQRAFQGGPFG